MLLYNSIRGGGSLSQGFQAKKSGIRQVGFVPPALPLYRGEGCVKVEPRKQRRKQVDSRSAFEYSCAPLFTGNFPRKQPRKILRNTCHRESQNCAREKTAKAVVAKAHEIRTKSLPGFRRRSIGLCIPTLLKMELEGGESY